MERGAELAGLLGRAERCMRDGRAGEAIGLFEQALALRDDLAEAWFNLAWLQRGARRFGDAMQSYGRAIERGIDRAEEAHLARATILSEDLSDTVAAKRELERALALNPRFVPAWSNLGHLCEDVGDAPGARHAYRRVLDEDPGNGRAHARLAMIDIASGRPDAAIASLTVALPVATSADDRSDLLFALAAAFDAQGRYRDAFEAVEAANLFARAVEPTRYDRRAHERLVDRLIAAFAQPPVPSPASRVDRPVFIVGMFRSGSTLAETLLGRHPLIDARGESDAIPALVRSLAPDYPENWRIAGDRSRSGRGVVEPTDRSSRVVIDKRCDNFLHIGLIKAIIPGAKFIHTVRNPLDNILSLYFLRFGDAVNYATDLADITHYHGQYRRLMRHWQRLHGADIHEFDYDRAVVDPRATLAETLDFLGLPWDDRLLVPETGSRAVRTASAWQVRQPLHARSSGRWRHYADHLGAVRERLGEAGS